MGCMAKHLAERLHTLLHQSQVCLAAHVADAKHLACQGSVIAAGNHALVAQGVSRRSHALSGLCCE